MHGDAGYAALQPPCAPVQSPCMAMTKFFRTVFISCLFLCSAAVCGIAAAQESTALISYRGNGSYMLVEKSDLRRYDNGKYTGLQSREVQSFIQLVDGNPAEPGSLFYDGSFFVVQETKRNARSVVQGIRTSIPSSFKITADGTLVMLQDNGFPSFRSFPAYPRQRIRTGDSWQCTGERAADPLGKGVVTRMPMLVQYTYLRDDVYNGKPVHVLQAQWATRYGLSYVDPKGDPDLKSAQGKHDATILVSAESGAAIVVRDTVEESFIYADGSRIDLKGTISLFTKYPPAYNKDKLIHALQRVAIVSPGQAEALAKADGGTNAGGTNAGGKNAGGKNSGDRTAGANTAGDKSSGGASSVASGKNTGGKSGGSAVAAGSKGSAESGAEKGSTDTASATSGKNSGDKSSGSKASGGKTSGGKKSGQKDKGGKAAGKTGGTSTGTGTSASAGGNKPGASTAATSSGASADAGSGEGLGIGVDSTADGIRLTIRNLQFRADSAELLPEEQHRLDAVATALKEVPGSQFLVEGHTASTGNPEGERRLSEERALAVARALVQRGIPAEQFICRGSGGTKPVADNSTPEGKAKNRRVEITILE